MTGRTHDLAAITALGIVALTRPIPNVSLSTALIAILANQIGGIAPDIDEPTAPFWRNLPVGGVFGRIIGKMLGGHRFLSHSLVGVSLFALLGYLLLEFIHPLMPHTNLMIIWWAFVIGLLSHLVMDSLTKEGVPWLLPIPFKFGVPPLRALRITTGKWLESLVVFPGILVFDIAWCWLHYQVILEALRHHLG
jgi:inner membrane protein